MKVIQKNDLYPQSMDYIYNSRGKWEALWIAHKNANTEKSGVYGYFLKFNSEEEKNIRINVSADNRYKLYFDGEFQGFGPERGDNDNWFFETYEINLTKGEHTIFAFTWFTKIEDNRQCAQFSYKPAFILCSEEFEKEKINTGYAPWKSIDLSEFYQYEYDNPILMHWYIGNRFNFHGKGFPIGYEKGEIGNWEDTVHVAFGEQKKGHMAGDIWTRWWLRPGTLPLEYLAPVENINVRYGETPEKYAEQPLCDKNSYSEETVKMFDDILNGHKSATIEPNKKYRIIADLNNYYCAYVNTKTTGGAGSLIHIQFAEALYDPNPTINKKWETPMFAKYDRNAIDGKFFEGYGDKIYPGGQKGESFQSPWWNSGRFVEIYVETKDEALTIDEISFTECHYDFKWEGNFSCSANKFTDFIPIAKRALEMCTHETYMDCPYYEQIMYVGDTRVETLATYAWEKSRLMPTKALDMFHASIRDNGITQSRYPSWKTQFIPPFSLWYIAMLYDYAMWCDDLKLVKSYLPDANSIIEFFLKHVNEEGIMESPGGWNFLDWTDGFMFGMTKNIDKGISGQYNIHLVYTLDILAKLEDILGEPEFAARHRRISDAIYKKTEELFWDEERGLFADDKEHTTYLEHTQCIAILSDHGQDKAQTMMKSLAKYDDIFRTTIYYSFYLFEAAKKVNSFDIFDDKVSFWSDLKKQGFKTTPECPEPARSDCHAWGAHPLYHLMTGILGINPSKPCFKEVKITPNLLSLNEVKGSVPHKLGDISVDFRKDGDSLKGTITLPEGLTGTYEYNGKTVNLSSGENKI